MKNITRLALAFALATIACLSPIAHADDPSLAPVEPGVNPVRYLAYWDLEGKGAMLVQDGPAHPNGKWITVTLYQNGYTYSGQGWRAPASKETDLTVQSEFWLYGNGVSAKFQGLIPIRGPVQVMGGTYQLNGAGTLYPWTCTLN